MYNRFSSGEEVFADPGEADRFIALIRDARACDGTLAQVSWSSSGSSVDCRRTRLPTCCKSAGPRRAGTGASHASGSSGDWLADSQGGSPPELEFANWESDPIM